MTHQRFNFPVLKFHALDLRVLDRRVLDRRVLDRRVLDRHVLDRRVLDRQVLDLGVRNILLPNPHVARLLAICAVMSALLLACGAPPAPAPAKTGSDKPAEVSAATEDPKVEPVAKTTAEEPTTALAPNDTAPTPDADPTAATGGPAPSEATAGPAPEGTPVNPDAAEPPADTSSKSGSKKSGTEKTTPSGDDGGEASASASEGAAPFGKHCKGCHGADGKGDTKFGKENTMPSLHGSKLSKTKIVAILKAGIPDSKMKSYEGKLTEAEMAAVAAYVKTL